ncbi:hypothetical protein AA0114_g11741 [Alternaria tenuissima]|uniref:Phytocyanin domain-containing protein n=1 Tax=Alternaria tenuissima TaxID=119927 RepID=A0A4Q4M0Z3_9PLEO|nr:hypothetical protein AA0114_g11741 [Alternaria tenuissima]
MSTPLARAATLTLMLVAVLAQGPTQTTTDGRMSVTSSATSVAPTASIASSTSYVATQTSASEVRVHVVKAGAGGFHFEPAELTNASVGDVVPFEFYPPDHSVARAEYGSACVPYEYTGRDRTGFWSETQWVKTPRDITHWNLTINSTEPIFYYCAAPDSCKGKQMVGVINPNDTQTLHEQVLAAARADYQLAPGDPVPNEASSTFAAPPAASSEGDLASADQSSPTLSTAAIAGITVGTILFLALCVGLLFFLERKARTGRQTAAGLHTQTDHRNIPSVNVEPAELGGGNEEKRMW